MLRKWILAIAMVMTASLPPVLRSQSTQSMPGMSGMKDSVAKRKPASKKKKQTKPGKKKSTVARKRPVSAMKMPRQAHDSSAGTRVTDSMPAMPSMPPRSDSSRPMNMTDSAPMRDTSAMRMPMGMAMGSSRPMTADDMMIGPLGVSMERMGSGTTWIPDAVTMPSRRTMMGSWMLMAHGFVFAQYDHQSGKRGDDQLGSVNWMMLMATKNLAGGRFQARTMLSLDALGVTSRGYPLLLQTGESFNGVLLHDRQHPHDFWMELGALYQRELSKTLGWSIYAAPSGEPALGPVAFMHRPSAMDNPTAPISHHWQDATHVTFGVLTGGLFARKFQIEGSLFNSRDPDQHRWNFDRIKLDSYSSRITFNPAAVWSLSAGYGFLRSHEAFDPAESMHRVTASVLNGRSVGSDGQVASALIWGANKHAGHPLLAQSFLGESEAILDRHNTVFGRIEWVQKSAEDLVVDNGSPSAIASGAPTFPTEQNFNVAALELGYIREILRTHWATLGLGGAGTINFVPSLLEPAYGSRTPLGAFVFLRLRPFHDRRTRVGGEAMETHE